MTPDTNTDPAATPDPATTRSVSVMPLYMPAVAADPSARAVVICSGGLDSVTLAHLLAAGGFTGERLHLLSVDYGQRHLKEVSCAAAAATRLGARFSTLALPGLARVLDSALTNPARPIPEGHYTAASMGATVVPNRNAILLALAYGVAVSVGAALVATAVHAGDHAIYPDCREEFVSAFDVMERAATEGFGHPDLSLVAPFLTLTKAQIVGLGAALGVPFVETWSCYVGGERHCGRCATCVERAEAFALAGVPDPTPYVDSDYWRTVTSAPASAPAAP